MSYETIPIVKKDAKTVHILVGAIVSTGNGVAEVNIDGYGVVSDVPVFYHCSESETADGMPFAKDDRVIIVNSGDAIAVSISEMKVVGFEDGLPRECCYAYEHFITGNPNYTWVEDHYYNHATMIDNSSFANDKFTLDMIAKDQPVGTWERVGLEYYAKCFNKPWANNTPIYLIVDISDDLQFIGDPCTARSFKFSVVFTSTQWNKWAEYSNTINIGDFPSGLPANIYYADVSAWLLSHDWDLDVCTFQAYLIRANAHLSYGEYTRSVVGVNNYRLCPSRPADAILLGGKESSSSFAPIDTYNGIYKC